MPALPHFEPETIAFWLGFLAATIFWWLARRVRALMPRLIESVRQQIRAARRKSQEKVDEYLRRETLRLAQTLHLAAPLFSLDEVLVAPVLIAPPPVLANQGEIAPDSITGQTIPYLPDWPQLASAYPVSTLSLAQALQNRVKIAVIGQPGCGKTVTLAALASQVARKDPAAGELAQAVPLLLHALDLVLEPPAADPMDVLIKALSARSPVLIQSKIPVFLRGMASEGQILLLLDGLDELPPAQIKKVSAFLESLFTRVPQIYAAVSAAPENLDGLSGLGFLPLAVTGWKADQCQSFVARWSKLWSECISPELSRHDPGYEPVDPRLLDAWLVGEWGLYSPLEWTLRVWGAYTGDVTGPGPLEALDALVRRLTQGTVSAQALALLANEYLKQNQVSLSYAGLENMLNRSKAAVKTAAAEVQPDGSPSPASKKTARPAKDAKKVSSGGRILNLLLDTGLLIEHPGEQLRLMSPLFTGLLASYAETPEPITLDQPVWSAAACAGRFLMARGQGTDLVQSLLGQMDDALSSRLLLAASWLSTAPANADWRPAVMRKMLQIIQQDNLPPQNRGRLAAAFAASNDPSLPLVFKQLFSSPSPQVRQVAALGSGVIRSPKLVGDLTALLADPSSEVRTAACLALAAYGGKVSAEITPQVLMNGEEALQQAAAESLASHPAGCEVLKNALELDNLLVRRAAVLALARVREPWALKRLEKVAVEDAQWIVRSAAGQAVENLQKPDTRIPAPLPIPSEAGWLLAFAGKQGVGVIPGSLPLDLLVKAAQEGSLEEKLSALMYLKDHADASGMRAITQAACSDQPILRDTGQYVLWYLAARGAEVPTPASIGIY